MRLWLLLFSAAVHKCPSSLPLLCHSITSTFLPSLAALKDLEIFCCDFAASCRALFCLNESSSSEPLLEIKKRLRLTNRRPSLMCLKVEGVNTTGPQ